MAEFLKPIKNAWMNVIKQAIKHKKEEFGDDAEEAMRFFDGPYDFIYSSKLRPTGDAPSDQPPWAKPDFEMTFNIVAEGVQLFGPALYHRNPYRQVTPATPPPLPVLDPNDPNAQMMLQQLQQQRLMRGASTETRAHLMGHYLNYTPNELDLRGNSRQVIDETLIKGMGLWWTSTFRPPGSPVTLIGSFYETVDNLQVDPDMESIEHAKWTARRRIFPTWEVERRFQLPPGTLRGSLESRQQQSHRDEEGYKDDRAKGETSDLFCYWEVYSRMGFGNRLRLASASEEIRAMNSTFDRFGDHVFLAVSDDYHCPLNLPDYYTERASMDEVFDRVQWPTPHWADHTDPWPFVYAAFHKRPRKVWPMSHFKPAMGEIKFLNWAFSFIAGKIKNTSRDFVGMVKSAGEEMKQAILGGKDLTLIEIESTHGKTISDVVSFLQHPNFNGDVYKVIEMMMGILERRLGLNELMYGQSQRQLRSASEAQIKGDQLRLRPDDMAECIEAAASKVARKEAMAAAWNLDPQTDVSMIGGPEFGMLWGQYVQNANPYEIALELSYRIEAGSIRKPNRMRDQENANMLIQTLAPFFTKYFELTGDPGPINSIFEIVAKANDLPVEKFQIQPPPPPQPDPQKMMEMQAEQEGEQQRLMMELQKMQAEMQLKMQEMQAKIASEERMAELEMAIKQMEAALELRIKEMEMHQKMALSAAEHRQEMTQDQQVHQQEMQQTREQGAIQTQVAAVSGQQKVQQQKEQGAEKLKQQKAQVAIAKKKAAAKPKKSAKKK